MARERNIKLDILPDCEPDANPNVEVNLRWSDFQFKSKWKYSRLAASTPHTYGHLVHLASAPLAAVSRQRERKSRQRQISLTCCKNNIKPKQNKVERFSHRNWQSKEKVRPTPTWVPCSNSMYTINCWHSHVVNHTVGYILVSLSSFNLSPSLDLPRQPLR